MIPVEFTQYLRPDGRQKSVTMHVADDLCSQYEAIKEVGARLECEVLMTEEVSLTIFDPSSEDDFDMELEQNGPDVPAAVDRLIRRFKQVEYRTWQAAQLAAAE